MATATTLPSNQGKQNQEQQNRTDDDNYGMDTDARQINSYLPEANLELETVLTYGIENTSALMEDLTPYVTTLGLEPSVECIRKIEYQQLVLFDITAKTIEDKMKYQ